MKCRLDYCIYNDANTCLLDSIEMDSIGMCGECILVYVPPDTLEEQKARQRKAING